MLVPTPIQELASEESLSQPSNPKRQKLDQASSMTTVKDEIE
jgi:hypothetical protein